MDQIMIRALLYRSKSSPWWIAQCLEYDLATAAKRLEDLPAELERFLTGQIAASLELGIEPFAGLPPAPKRFWQRYEDARHSSGSAVELIKVSGAFDIGAMVQTRIAA
jgi:hypothetical protein